MQADMQAKTRSGGRQVSIPQERRPSETGMPPGLSRAASALLPAVLGERVPALSSPPPPSPSPPGTYCLDPSVRLALSYAKAGQAMPGGGVRCAPGIDFGGCEHEHDRQH